MPKLIGVKRLFFRQTEEFNGDTEYYYLAFNIETKLFAVWLLRREECKEMSTMDFFNQASAEAQEKLLELVGLILSD